MTPLILFSLAVAFIVLPKKEKSLEDAEWVANVFLASLTTAIAWDILFFIAIL